MKSTRKRLCALCAALVLGVLFGGCGSAASTEPSAPSEEGGVPLAAWAEEPVIAQTVVNSGVSLEYVDGLRMSEYDSYWRLFERWDNGALAEVGPLVNLENDLEPWAVLQHEDYRFWQTAYNPGYAVDQQYIYWLEVPATYNTTADRWYLYLRSLPQDEEEMAPAVCVAEGAFDRNSDGDYRSGIPFDWESRDGLVLWAQPEGEAIVGRLYRADTGETTELFRTDGGDTRYAEVALTADEAFWTIVDGAAQTSSLTRCDLASGETTEIGEGHAAIDPVVVGDYLVVRDVIDAEGFAADEDDYDGDGDTHEIIGGPNALLVYDCIAKEWNLRMTSDLAAPEGATQFGRPLVIDDRHIALAAIGTGEAYELAAVDLAQGKIYALESAPKTPLLYCPPDCSEESLEGGVTAVTAIQTPDRSGSNPVTMWTIYENGMGPQKIVYSVNFHW